MTAPVPILSIQGKAFRHGPHGIISASPRQVSLRAKQTTDVNNSVIESYHIALNMAKK
jgi:hypothetical protein